MTKLIVTVRSFATAPKIPFLHNTYNFFRLLASSAPADVLLMMLVGREYLFTGTPARSSLVEAARACQVHFLRSKKLVNYAVCYGLVLKENASCSRGGKLAGT
jgi:hypothetical protein